ncbi:hypothetical protein BEN30_14760 [Magnetovibrio blakemorei]|uniref:Chemoreceptor zinc-binding domain-containing protein n=2 Tax=Magnetovibrio blakemorei TaxID=28181 RepID=A0A1E5Q4Z5_9PROT|nr:hypothetical protein BEN30_14760 [Magnetovibrio blakemorei]
MIIWTGGPTRVIKGPFTMDFQIAVHWHMAWLKKMLADIQNPSKLKPEEIARDDLCEIGKWIHGEAVQYRELPEYQDLKNIHMELHKATSQAVVLAQAGKLSEAKKYLSLHGDFIETSKRLLDSCNRLIKKINQNTSV